MDYPFIDAGSLSDDELMKRIQRCTQVIASEGYFGHSSIVQSAMAQLETYQFEWNERMQTRARKDFFEKNPRLNKTIDIGVTGETYYPDDKDDKKDNREDR